MRMTVILIEVDALRMVPKRLKRKLEEVEIRGRIETIQTAALLRSCLSTLYLDMSRRTEATFSHSDSSERPPVKLVWKTHK